MLKTSTYNGLPTARLTGWLWSATKDIQFDSVICPFCGSGAAARLFKEQGCEVTATAVFTSFARQARALIENDSTTLDQFEAEAVIGPSADTTQLMEGIAPAYGLPHSFGAWLDRCRANIERMDHEYKKSLAYTAVSKVIAQVFSLGEQSVAQSGEEDWNQVFRFYVAALNDMVFSNGRLCLAYEGNPERYVMESNADALCLYLPRESISKLTEAERFSELFNRFCHEKQMMSELSAAENETLGTALIDTSKYADLVSNFLERAKHIKLWFICASSDAPVATDEIYRILAGLKNKVTVMQKEMVYSKNISRKEYIYICE
ncbi:MAG TPA: class I SAM-dependent methyltransferase [bacterium]|nr:class I SAM-dependent methyltransferase [bacterium]